MAASLITAFALTSTPAVSPGATQPYCHLCITLGRQAFNPIHPILPNQVAKKTIHHPALRIRSPNCAAHKIRKIAQNKIFSALFNSERRFLKTRCAFARQNAQRPR
jgi:hypothetical protein